VTGIIDVWAQSPNHQFMAQPWLATLLRWTGQQTLGPVPVSATLAAMDDAGVERALVCAWSSPGGMLITNDEVENLVSAHPDRFVGVAAVDLRNPVAAVRELRRASDLGMVALRIVPWLWDLPPNDRRYYPLYTACVELGLPFCTQIGHTGPLCRSEPGRPIPYLDDVLLDFPELVVVGGHVGYPWIDEVISLATKYPNFHVDTSAYTVSRLPVPWWSSCGVADEPASCSERTGRCSRRHAASRSSRRSISTTRRGTSSWAGTPRGCSSSTVGSLGS
jgi:predicted TIM-barrel fold metal-dependent hydrolase